MATPLPRPEEARDSYRYAFGPEVRHVPADASGGGHGIPLMRPRPGGVTFAGIVGIVNGALATLAALTLVILIPFIIGIAVLDSLFGGSGVGAIEISLVLLIVLVPLAAGIFAIVAGVKTLGGRNWARRTLVIVLGLGALLSLGAFPVGLVFAGVNVAAIVCLHNTTARAYFAR